MTLADPGWKDFDEVMEWAALPVPLITTVGYLIYECKDHIVVVDSIADDQAGGDCGNPWKIPKKWIKNRKELR